MKVRVLAAGIVLLVVVLLVPVSRPLTGWIGERLGLVEPPPVVRGDHVVAINQEQGIVVLNIGADDGVQSGDEFHVYRQDQFIGRVRATKVTSGLSGARIMYLALDHTVQVNDTVTRGQR